MRDVTNLDKYIDLILRNVTNIDEFIYLMKKSDIDDQDGKGGINSDPYDLQVVDYNTIDKKN